jgi:hypothetical protein
LPFHFIAYLDPISGVGHDRESIFEENVESIGKYHHFASSSGITNSNGGND